MKLLVGLITLMMALIISGVAAYFSVIGLAALFAATFWPVVVMGTSLEAGKLVAAGWLHDNWKNPLVNRAHKMYLTAAVGVLMMITAIGIYGFLAKGHLEQTVPLGPVQLKIAQSESKIAQAKEEIERQSERLNQMDAAVDTLIQGNKAQQALQYRERQKRERDGIRKEIDARTKEINQLNEELVPLRLQVNDVSAKLGPVKYIASLFGFKDPESAVQIVIIALMFAFDPLAVVLLISATITIGEWARERRISKRFRAVSREDRDARTERLSERVEPKKEPEIPVPAPAPVVPEPEPVKMEEPIAPLRDPIDPPEPEPEYVDPSYRVGGKLPKVEQMDDTYILVGGVPRDPPPPNDRDRLLEILERKPELLQELIDATVVPVETPPKKDK